jgi:adenine/guanine/hypoxanthine permease
MKFANMNPEGGKTGITAMMIGFMFFVSVFFAPVFASIPSWATGGALVIVGSLMIVK